MPYKDEATRKAAQTRYESLPETKLMRRLWLDNPEQKESKAKYNRYYYNLPEQKAKRVANTADVNVKVKRAEYSAREDVKERRAVNDALPKSKVAMALRNKARQDNPEYRLQVSVRRKARYASDIEFKLGISLRSRLNRAIKDNTKQGSAIKLLGCTVNEVIFYLEAQFIEGMSWENWSLHGWHIDHIKSLASFNLEDPTQLAMACHYSNLQPLWAKDNLSKGSK
jgi:hypothetical protein